MRIILSAVMLVSIGLAGPLVAQDKLTGRAEVVDGDTLRVNGQTVRLHGVDAPEGTQTCLDAAGKPYDCGGWVTAQVKRTLRGRTVSCRGDETDRYGRLIATCQVAGRDLGAVLTEAGLVLAFERYSTRYVAAQNTARAARRGLWAGRVQPPWEFRRTGPQPVRDTSAGTCVIKGNISGNGRIYHLPGQEHYGRTRINTAKGERWFCSEADARAAGWRRARR